MFDIELANALKDLNIKIQTPSVKERKQVIENVINVLSYPGITEGIITGICRVVPLTIHRYRDGASQSFIRKLISALVDKYPEVSIDCFIELFSDLALQFTSLISTDNVSQSALYALDWTIALLQCGWKKHEETIPNKLEKIVEAQAIFLTSIAACGKNKKIKKAYNLLNETWSSITNSELLYLKTLNSLERNQFLVVLESAVLKRCSNTDPSAIEEFLDPFLNTFLKHFISCKVPPQANIIRSCYPLLAQINLEKFKLTVLPALQKAMLRNPEVILETVGLVILGVQLDLSSCAMDIGSSLITNLHSKDEKARADSSISCKYLAGKISEAKAIDQLLTKTFAVYHGKLTVAEHKMGVLQGAGNLSYSNVPQEKILDLISKATIHFTKVLETEMHEKTLCFALEMLSLWTSKLSTVIPEALLDIFKNGPLLKTSTPLVQLAYFQCMLATFSCNNISQAENLVPMFKKSVQKAVTQSTQPLSINMGLCASLLLIRFDEAKLEKGNGLSVMWCSVFDMEKQIFVSEKFLQTANESSLPYVTQLCEKLLVNYSEKIINKTEPVLKAIIHCALHSSTKNRKNILAIVENMIGSIEGARISIILLQQLQLILENNKINFVKEKCDNAIATSPHAVAEFITSLCRADNWSIEDSQDVAIATILPAHHPLVIALDSGIWIKIVKRLKCVAKYLMVQRGSELNKLLIIDFKVSEAYKNAIATFVFLNPDIILPKLLDYVKTKLEDPRICQITKDDYLTFLMPEGELYDKTVIPHEGIEAEINLKRESKVYSYKEQLEELQLKREMEEKQKKEGKVKYTPKQLEAIKNQTLKEENIRRRLKELDEFISKSVSMIRAAAAGNPLKLSLYYKDLIPLILQDLQSCLAAPYLTKLFVDLRDTIFSTQDLKSLGESIAKITLRLCKPQCDPDPNWEQENLNKAVARVIRLIHEKTVQKRNNGTIASTFTGPAFSYSFSLLKYSLTSNYAKKHEELIHDGLQIISEHAKLRVNDESSDIDLYHPKYLPTKQMILLLVEIICKSSGHIQAQAAACLLDIAYSVGGKPGCTRASLEEIDVLLTALQSAISVVRDAALRALIVIVSSLPSFKSDYGYALKLNKRILIAKFDDVEENRKLADDLWDKAGMEFPATLSKELMSDIEHPVECVQTAAAKALAVLLKTDQNQVELTIKSLIKLYNDRLTMISAKVNEFDREIEQAVDIFYPRRGVAVAIGQLASLITPELVGELMQFFISTSLRDRNETVRKEMLSAASKMVDVHGKETVRTLWPVFDNFMSKSSKSAQFDAVKEAVVILMGTLARHLDKDDERIKPIVSRLIQALSTPSQTVQQAVANCLPPLVPSLKDEVPGFVNKLLHQLLKADKYGERKGAAYGLAGLVKGMGIFSLRQYDIMNKLTEAVQDKKNYKHREGALFAFEMLFEMLGKLFEPYIIHVLPHLLQCFGDTSQYVRVASNDTSRVVMAKLSGHGVKLILPGLLEALEEDSWRTKAGSVELLGSMAYCAPKQLSSCLPSIVPKLIEILGDSHMKVQEAGATALKVIGSVIRNPEIQAIVPVLLKALQDPSNKTSVCLQTLLDTQFVHFIDAPSLALIMPVVQRSFTDRSTETRKMAAQIIGNMYSLTDQKDLMPYLPDIIPGLKTSLLDPVPQVRTVSARALGAVVRGMGESTYEDLLPWLMQTLTSETSSVDRSGAAQGLSEVVGGLGVKELHKFMPEIISTAERNDIAPHVKDGYIMMFIYMPVVFTSDFTPYIGHIINPILKALADENEYVRETALKAGQRIVNLYADSAILLLLPELERGLLDENWRIRLSSVQLLGDLLYRISGITGKISTAIGSEDDNFGTEKSHMAIIRALGADRRNRVLAGLYMGRSDESLMVRQAALHVWKMVVTKTPRTLREILPTLFSLLLGCLASDSYDKRQVAARTLGDLLVRKLGERVLPEIIPIIEKGLQSDQPDQRQGVCIGLSEIMASTSKETVLTFLNSLVPTVAKALCDPLLEVRQAAAKTFDSLHSTLGTRALDDILPNLLNQLNDDDPEVVEYTLDGLRQVMAINSKVLLPYLVPQLTAPPANTKALSILAPAAGDSLNKYLPRILPALQTALATSKGTPEEAQQLEYCQDVLLSVVDEVGIRTIIDTTLENTRNVDANQRRAAATLLRAFCANSKAQYWSHVPQLLRGLVHLMTDTDEDVLQISWEALNVVTKALEPKQQASLVSDLRQAVRYAVSDMKPGIDLPGFCLPKGIVPILPIFREALLYGAGNEKEAAALGLSEVISVTSAQSLQPSIVAITGPLIRILGDRFSANVKTAVLDTLAVLLSKVGVMLRQFLPQLQTTFVKALSDSNRTVRLKSATALRHLIVIHLRADPLFTEVHNMVKNNEDVALKETTLHAMRGLITAAGDKMSETVMEQIHATLITYVEKNDDSIRKCAAGCLGAICTYLPAELLDKTLSEHLLNDNNNANVTLRESRASALTVALKESSKRLWDDQYRDRVTQVLLSQLQSQIIAITQSAIRSCGYLLEYILINFENMPNQLLMAFVRTMNNSNNEVKKLLARVLCHLAKILPGGKLSPDFLRIALPTLVNGTKEKNVYVKANSEIALIAMLRLKEGDEVFQKYSSILDSGAKESLIDVIKVLKEIIHQREGKDDDIDDTLLT